MTQDNSFDIFKAISNPLDLPGKRAEIIKIEKPSVGMFSLNSIKNLNKTAKDFKIGSIVTFEVNIGVDVMVYTYKVVRRSFKHNLLFTSLVSVDRKKR